MARSRLVVVLAPDTVLDAGAVVIRDIESSRVYVSKSSLVVGAEDHAVSAIAGDHTIVVSEPPPK
jgi:hypothetical protein